jgi:DNA-binding NtrC family response regulator
VVIEGNDMGRAVSVGEAELTVGTDEGCDLVLHDDHVSRRHASMRAQEDGYLVRDLESRNGTVYAGSRIASATVPLGATLKIGHTFLRLQALPEPVEIAPSQSRRFGELVAESLAMREVFAVLELAAQSDFTVLLEGETGTGKELAARALHEASGRRRAPFVALDCGALPESLLESELFGHVRGSFTGATGDRKGAFLRAGGGTVFLDELDSVPLQVQARLLRVAEDRTVRPVGSDVEREVDVRLVAASRANLSARVAEGAFRPDLFYRLSVMRVVLPPLRQRREDIPLIVSELLRRRGFEDTDMGGPALDRLYGHDWPGNVRELRNVVDRALALAPQARCFRDLPVSPAGSPAGVDQTLRVRSDRTFAEAKQQIMSSFERQYLRDVLARCAGNISATARATGLDRKHLKTLLHRHGLIGSSE